MQRHRLICIFTCTGLLATGAIGQDRQQLDAYIKSEMDRQHIPGLSLSILKGDGVMLNQAYGLADLELNQPVQLKTIFKFGSISKPILAAATLRLIEAGRLELNSEVRPLLPGLPDGWNGIQIQHLLSHTSGLPRELPDWTSDKPYTNTQLLEMIAKAIPTTRPGEKYAYSNCAYFTLAQIIAKVTEKPWSEAVKELVFTPAGMETATTTDWRPIIANRASGYVWGTNSYQNDGLLMSIRPSGAFQGSIHDLEAFDQALRTQKIVRSETLALMQRPFTLLSGDPVPYGLGFGLDFYRGLELVGHNGALQGFRTAWLRSGKQGISVIVLTNSASANPDAIAKGVWRWVLPQLSLKNATPITDTESALTRTLWEGLANVGNGVLFGAGAVAPLQEVLKNLPDAQRTSLKNVVAKSRGLQLCRTELVQFPLYRNEARVTQIRYYRFEGAEPPRFLTAHLNKDGKLAGFELTED